jgi:mannosyltransferase OCH1-like enzyme
MDTWKKFLPDYTIKRWSTKSFNLDSVPLAKQAFESKRYAFAADYIRAYALYTEGGIYLDSDVMIHKDPHLLFADAEYVSGLEFMPADLWKYSISIDEGCRRLADVDKISGVGLQAAVMASVPGHPLTKKILEYYKDKDLQYILGNNILAPIVQARCAEEFDFRYTNTEQHLDCGIVIYPTGVIGQNRNEVYGRYMTHMCAGSWLEKKPTLKQRLKKWIKH